MKDLTSHGHLTLLAVVASMIADPDAIPLQKQSLYNQYQDLVQATDRDPLGGRAFHNHLAELSMLGILDRTKQNEGRAGGSTMSTKSMFHWTLRYRHSRISI